MNAFFVLVFILGGALAIGRGLDLALWTSWETGLCLTGSVWLRYAALAVAVLGALLAGYRLARRPDILRSECRHSGRTVVLAAAFFALGGVCRLLFGLTGPGAPVRALLEVVCGVWFASLARSWMRSGEYRLPNRSMATAVLGTAVFYWAVLSRFMENSSSWYRVEPTAMIWQLLSALLFLSALVRALWLPESTDGRMLCMAGLACFVLCFCWELPRVLVPFFYGLTVAQLPDLFFGAGLCCVGTLGMLSTARVAASGASHPKGKHSVG